MEFHFINLLLLLIIFRLIIFLSAFMVHIFSWYHYSHSSQLCRRYSFLLNALQCILENAFHSPFMK